MKAAMPKCRTSSASAAVTAADRPAAVRDPVAAGADVQARAGQAGHFHRERVVAGGDAGPAVVDDFGRLAAAERRFELAPQNVRRLERAVGDEVVVAEPV